jgi:hypothetical protein
MDSNLMKWNAKGTPQTDAVVEPAMPKPGAKFKGSGTEVELFGHFVQFSGYLTGHKPQPLLKGAFGIWTIYALLCAGHSQLATAIHERSMAQHT